MTTLHRNVQAPRAPARSSRRAPATVQRCSRHRELERSLTIADGHIRRRRQQPRERRRRCRAIGKSLIAVIQQRDGLAKAVRCASRIDKAHERLLVVRLTECDFASTRIASSGATRAQQHANKLAAGVRVLRCKPEGLLQGRIAAASLPNCSCVSPRLTLAVALDGAASIAFVNASAACSNWPASYARLPCSTTRAHPESTSGDRPRSDRRRSVRLDPAAPVPIAPRPTGPARDTPSRASSEPTVACGTRSSTAR